jgi:hypothetical protein
MKDLFNLPSLEENIFVYNASLSGDTFQVWSKPMNTTMIYFYLFGAGGGGAGGQSGSGIGRTGGAGGGAGALSSLIIPSIFLPDTLYISVATGGIGGIAGGNGEAARTTFISTQQNTKTGNLVLSASGGGGGVGATAGAGGTAFSPFGSSTVWGIGNFFGGTIGLAGAGGTAGGGNGGVATPVAPIVGGAGGAGSSSLNVNGSGGSVSGNEIMPVRSGGPGGGTNKGQDGLARTILSNSSSVRSTLYFSGGAGGAGFGTGTGGAGGDASYGCGGGGGGAGTTGGAGGRGGDGLVIITCY